MAKKGGKGNKKTRRFAEQAAAEALIRFGPELSGLKELQRSAQSTYASGVAQAQQNALGISGAARAARPQIQRVYEKAGGQLTNTWNQVDQDIAPGAGSAIEQAIVAENAASRSRLREARTHSKRDLTNRIVNAQEGRVHAVNAARSTLASELGKVQRRRADVLREKGAFTSATLSGLLESDLDRQTRAAIQRMSANQQERNSLRSSGIDPDTGKAIPGGKLDPDANATPGNQKPSASDTAAARAQRERERKRNEKLREQSIKGVTKVQDAAALWKRYSSLTKDGKPPTAADVETRLIEEGYRKREVDIARDLLRNDGRLSVRGVRAMRELGWRTPKRWRPRPFTTSGGQSFAPGANGQIRPN